MNSVYGMTIVNATKAVLRVYHDRQAEETQNAAHLKSFESNLSGKPDIDDGFVRSRWAGKDAFVVVSWE